MPPPKSVTKRFSKLVQVKLGMPKNRTLMKLMEHGQYPPTL